MTDDVTLSYLTPYDFLEYFTIFKYVNNVWLRNFFSKMNITSISVTLLELVKTGKITQENFLVLISSSIIFQNNL